MNTTVTALGALREPIPMHVVVALPDSLFECKACGTAGDLDTLMNLPCTPTTQLGKMRELEPRLYD